MKMVWLFIIAIFGYTSCFAEIEPVTTGVGVYASDWATILNANDAELDGNKLTSLTIPSGSTLRATLKDASYVEVDLSGIVGTGGDDQTASEVVFTPNGSIAATDVQAAIQEVRDEAGSGASELDALTDVGGDGTAGYVLYDDGDGTFSFAAAPDSMVYPGAGVPISLGVTGWDDSLSFTELVQSLPGSDLATQLDGEDLAPGSVTMPATATPTASFKDSGSLDADQTIATIGANATTETAGSVESDVLFYNKYRSASGVFDRYMWMDGSEQTFKFDVPISSDDPISAPITTATDADAHTLTWEEYHGGSVLATGAGVYTLPAAADGLTGCVEAGQGVAAIIQLLPASGDYIVYEGARGTAATSLKSSGATGDKICYTAYNADDWYVSTFGTWAE